MKHKKTFLGVGWKFPPTFERDKGSVILVSEEQDIKESLYILLSTKPGERVMLPDFGCDLHKVVFSEIDTVMIYTVKRLVRKAVLNFEPRITLEDVEVFEDPENDGMVRINLVYTIRKTNIRSNMVYPYYIIEGNNVRFRPL